MTGKRLPSFNDFSPTILKDDLRLCLAPIRDSGGDDEKVVKAWQRQFFSGVVNKRSTTNIPATLRSTGLTTGTRPLSLSEFGKEVLDSESPAEAAQKFCAGLIKHRNGDRLLTAIGSLRRRGESITKESLKEELVRLGIDNLSTATTDHTTLKNWMMAAGILDEEGAANDELLKTLVEISATEMDEWASLPLPHQVFLRQLRLEHLTSPGPFQVSGLLRACLEQYPDLFNAAHFAKQVREPLISKGWIEVQGLAKGAQGGKSGWVKGTDKLLNIPKEWVVPDFESVVPSELRDKIDTPLAEIQKDLRGKDTHLGGLALELLALRMVMDLGLQPRKFRLRSGQSAYAEVDLLAEGSHLMFSRWTFQCKRYQKGSSAKADLGDVAKEVGIALYVHAHVVVMVTTTSFTADAKKYARSISDRSPLQFLFIDGKVIDRYLSSGKSVLLEHARNNAAEVMTQKQTQPGVNSTEQSASDA